jgi:hypothetical protein
MAYSVALKIEGSTSLGNTSKLLPSNMASPSTRQYSSQMWLLRTSDIPVFNTLETQQLLQPDVLTLYLSKFL